MDDPVPITSGVNKGKTGVVRDRVVSAGTLLYLVERENGSSWVEENQMEVPVGPDESP
ncbi:hypothetical protein OJ996_05075 [Luteolibacter sp. GHJ8]|uniref:Uncharacterized protein n=1 Tax=Luteolibacter rhizosphaerae TaxID=2989719 RepID=A0ABT3FZE2_9BACT|nr:hypothetical protein [Luteolibacter rhizosphaerae]MCW1912933.1 hypothetical protein [Luteolibacter rhizosphaerae]